jgi:hypothetical protein
MKNKFYVNSTISICFFCFIFLQAINTNIYAQQVLGAHKNIDAGFESQSAGNLTATSSPTSLTAWTHVLSGNGQTRSISTTGGHGGPVFLTLGKTATATQNSNTVANSNVVGATAFLSNTTYIVQFHYKENTASAATPDPQSFVFISADGTSGNRITNSITLARPTTWTKFTSTVTTNSVTPQTATGTCGLSIRTTAIGTATVVDIDNFVVYSADDQTTPIPDVTAPAAPTSFNAIGNPAVVNLNWTAPASGIDGGGYMIVRFTSDPDATAQPSPIQNAVYKANVANVIGTTGTVVFIGDGTSTTFDDATAVLGTSYWYRIYTVDKAFNYSVAAATAGPVSPTTKLNYYYNGVGAADNLSSWFSNPNFTGTNPTSFSAAGQVFRIIRNTTLPSTLSISGAGSLLMIGAPSPGVPGLTVNFNSANLPAIDTIYQSSDGNPTILNFNAPSVPPINQLFDIFTEVHYRSPGIVVSTTKVYDKIFIENNADVVFNGSPGVQTSFSIENGSSATLGTLSTRWLTVNSGGTVTINGTLRVPKLTGLVSSNTAASSAGGAIQFLDTELLTLGSASTIEYSGISVTTTQNITPRTDYANLILSGVGISKTFVGPTLIAGTLTVNTTGATGTILNTPITVNGGLTLTSGLITTTATNILTLGANATVNGGSSSSFINGTLRRNTNSTSSFVFPVGKANVYRPISITPFSTAVSLFQSEYFNTAYSNTTSLTAPLSAVSNAEFWEVNRVSGADATVSFSLNGIAVNGATANDELVVARYNGTSWQQAHAGSINPGNAVTGTVTSNALGTFGAFTFGVRVNTSLPLQLVNLLAKKNSNSVDLSWETINETNVSHFEIERSNNGIQFSNVGSLQSLNRITRNSYSFTDVSNLTSNVWYRLRIIDKDASVSYSQTVLVKNQTADVFSILKNPVINKNLEVQFSKIPTGKHSLQLYDFSGRTILSRTVQTTLSNSSISIVLPNTVIPGVYLLSGFGKTYKVVIQ